jgi:hypothetical protein
MVILWAAARRHSQSENPNDIAYRPLANHIQKFSNTGSSGATRQGSTKF